jgi:23S rRNA-/tRNA-specific pseudouridylate synthase
MLLMSAFPLSSPGSSQVPPTVDNVLESVVACAATALDLPPQQLLNTHRLDAGTSGVVVLAKSTQAASAFTKLLQDKLQKVVKVTRWMGTRLANMTTAKRLVYGD